MIDLTWTLIKAGRVLESFGALFTLNSKGWFIAVLLFYVNLQVVFSLRSQWSQMKCLIFGFGFIRSML
jgi:hypothetical protein